MDKLQSKTFDWRCPSCSEKGNIESIIFAHFIWKHPFEYVKLKRAKLSRKEMVKATNENAKLILQQSSIEKEKKRNSSSSLPNVEEISSANVAALIKCEWCFFASTEADQLAEHDINVHVSHPRYPCGNCAMRFPQPINLHNHIIRYHGSSLICSACYKHVDNKEDFCAHVYNESKQFLVNYYRKKEKWIA